MREYNGHRSRNAWSVALTMGNDESIYRFAMDCIAKVNKHEKGLNAATRAFMRVYGGNLTPEGCVFNALSVKLALEGFMFPEGR